MLKMLAAIYGESEEYTLYRMRCLEAWKRRIRQVMTFVAERMADVGRAWRDRIEAMTTYTYAEGLEMAWAGRIANG